jgi:hypothetical protein
MSTELITPTNRVASVNFIDKYISKDKKDLNIPITVMREFGCFGCDWRGTKMCSHNLPKGTGHRLDLKGLGKEFEGICEKRKSFLKMIYSGIGKTVNKSQIRRDFRDFSMNNHYIKDLQSINRIDEQLEDCSITQDTDKEQQLEERRDLLVDRVFNAGLALNKLDEHEKDRLSKEKVAKDLNQRLDLSTIHAVMSGKVVDAEIVENDSGNQDQIEDNSDDDRL